MPHENLIYNPVFDAHVGAMLRGASVGDRLRYPVPASEVIETVGNVATTLADVEITA